VSRRPTPELSGRPRRRLTAQVRREEPTCWLCGKGFDYTLHWNHPMAFSVDEVIPRSLHPLGARYAALDRSGCRAAHRSCNSSRGNGTRTKRSLKIVRSRVW
jgi:5-methylcytosine-specific restriction endonuclease McrA